MDTIRLEESPDVVVQTAAVIAAQRQFAQRLRQRTVPDPLTGLPVRSLLIDRLELALAAAGPDTGRLAVLCCDLGGITALDYAHGVVVADAARAEAAGRLVDRGPPGRRRRPDRRPDLRPALPRHHGRRRRAGHRPAGRRGLRRAAAPRSRPGPPGADQRRRGAVRPVLHPGVADRPGERGDGPGAPRPAGHRPARLSPGRSVQRQQPGRQRAPQLVRGVLGHEVRGRHRDLGQRRPAPHQLPLPADQDRPRLGVDEQLRDVGVRQPLRRSGRRRRARPAARARSGSAAATPASASGPRRLPERRAGTARAPRRTARAAPTPAAPSRRTTFSSSTFRSPSGPRMRLEDRARAARGQSAQISGVTIASVKAMPRTASRVPGRPVEAQRRAPVVQHEGDPLGRPRRVEEARQEVGVHGEGVGAAPGVGQLAGVAHADQVRGDAAARGAARAG